MDKENVVIFLDVDGVINHLYAMGRNLPGFIQNTYRHGEDSGYLVGTAWPEWMPELIRYLVDNYEVHWLTTWREYANEQIAPKLDIPELPVITDGSGQRIVSWKPKAAKPVAEKLLAEGKRIIWIEDFYGQHHQWKHIMPAGVEYIDTGVREGLFGDDIAELLPDELVEKTKGGCFTCQAPENFHETWCPEFRLSAL